MTKKYFKRNGFTLIELLVVIAIIGVLATIVLVSLNGARVKARDARRKSDMKQMQLALEMYADDNNGNYPAVNNAGGWVYSCDSSWNALQTVLSKYMPTLPKDPVNTSCAGPFYANYYTYAYGYYPQSYPGKYDLVTALENTSDPARCGVAKWLYHTGGVEGIWCSGGMGYWDQLYADH